MEENSLIEFGKFKYYLLDGVKFGNIEYFTAEKVDDDYIPTKQFEILKVVNNGDKVGIGTVTNRHEMSEVINALLDKVLEKCKDQLFKKGSVVAIEDEKYVIVDYIPNKSNVYVILSTIIEPYKAKVFKIITKKEDNQIGLEKIEDTESEMIMHIFTSLRK